MPAGAFEQGVEIAFGSPRRLWAGLFGPTMFGLGLLLGRPARTALFFLSHPLRCRFDSRRRWVVAVGSFLLLPGLFAGGALTGHLRRARTQASRIKALCGRRRIGGLGLLGRTLTGLFFGSFS